MSDATQRPIVLVVDDEPAVLQLVAKVLASSGYDTRSAEGADAALQVLMSEPVDVIVADKNMPMMDGFALIEHARLRRADLAVVLMTAHAERLPPGVHVDGYLPKPFRSIGEVASTVRSALDARERRRLQQRLSATMAQLKSKSGPER